MRRTCAGSITLDLADWLEPYQRIGSDVDAQIQRWGALSVSLREMRSELAHSYMGVLGQRTLQQRLQQLQALTPGADERPISPIVQFDAIWFTQLCAIGAWRTDRRGCERPVKGKRKRCLRIALGGLGRTPGAKRSWPGSWPTAKTRRAGSPSSASWKSRAYAANWGWN